VGLNTLGFQKKKLHRRVFYSLVKFIKDYVMPSFNSEERRIIKRRVVL